MDTISHRIAGPIFLLGAIAAFLMIDGCAAHTRIEPLGEGNVAADARLAQGRCRRAFSRLPDDRRLGRMACSGRPRVYRLVAESPFASANSLTQGGAGLDLPAVWLTEANFDNASTIRGISTPLLLLHGREESFVRYIGNGRLVYRNAPDPKREVVIDGGHHSDIPQTLGVENYLALLRSFMDG